MESESVSLKGWNWGYYKLNQDNMSFSVNGQKSFVINYKDIALSNASAKNELALEFNQDPETKNNQADILCEMRFYVPNNELDNMEEKEPKPEKKKETKRKASGSKSGSDVEEEEESDNEPEITPAKVLHDKIVKAAGLGEFAGDVIASLPDLPMIIPRGKYALDFYSTFLKLHGRTHDYKILYKDVQKGFLLPKPDGVHMVFVLQLKSPLRQGQTLHHFIAVQLEKKDRDGKESEKVKINLSAEQIKEKYGDRLQPEMEGLLFDIISKLFKEIIKINILIPGEFRSSKDDFCVKCAVKAQDGHLYPLKSSLIFIHKPVIYLKHSEISYVELQRLGAVGGGAMQGRSFDMTITKLSDGTQTTFSGIDKEEQRNLISYFKSKNIKIRQLDVETQQQYELSESDEEMEEEESKRGKRATKGADTGALLDDDYDSEEDEDFDEDKSPEESEGSEDDDDISMDEEEVDKEELADMKKQLEETKNLGKRKGGRGHHKKSDKKSKKKSKK